MDECRKEYENWVKEYALNVEPFIDTIDCKSAFYAAWKVGHEKGFSDGAASACNELANCHQSEIDALKAQVEELKADADRWRYFRETASEEMCYALCSNSNPENNELDKAIDQAIQQQKGE